MCNKRIIVAAALAVAGLAQSAPAEDAYCVLSPGELTLTEGAIPAIESTAPFADWAWWSWALRPSAVLDGPGEVYVGTAPQPGGAELVAMRVPLPAETIEGRLFVPRSDLSGMVAVRFEVPVPRDPGEDRVPFLAVKLAHYENLLDHDAPGAAWFRRQARLVRAELGDSAPAAPSTWRRAGDVGTLESTFALVSGGRALAENLALDRALPVPADAGAGDSVAIDSIDGITVRAFDWQALTAGLDPRLDALAAIIPEDQHALFLPAFQALVDLLDHGDSLGVPVVDVFEQRCEDDMSRASYERQLGLPLDALARALGPKLVASVAVTGSDPYFRTGTDVALLLESADPAGLRTLLETRIAAAIHGVPGVAADGGEIDGIAYRGLRTADRTVSSYLAVLGNAVVATNSTVQLRRLVDVFKERTPPLAHSLEYRYFRNQYATGEQHETAFLIISDATIRRWCGPQWRIASSRRTRAAAVMADIQAEHFLRLVRGEVQAGPVHTSWPLPADEELTLTPSGIQSSVHGTLAFLTPIVELDLTRATKQEAEAYERWRQGYERQWRESFDPIAARLSLREGLVALDLSVMPLMIGTSYGPLIDVSRGASIAPGVVDGHPQALAHLALAVNKQSSTALMGAGAMSGMARGAAPDLRFEPLGWLGETISLYVDDGPLWDELANAPDPLQALQDRSSNLPIALHAQVQNGVKLIGFLNAARTFIEQTTPGMTAWETREHAGTPYVRVTPTVNAGPLGGLPPDAELCYMASGDALIVTLDEAVLKRAIERRAARAAGGQPAQATARAWLGRNMCVQFDRRALDLVEKLFGEQSLRRAQAMTWRSLPILNEWRAVAAPADPLSVHEQFWHSRLVCPGGGEYRWNERSATFESTVYGCPAEPGRGPALPPALNDVTFVNGGIDFVNDGLRARVEIERRP